MYGIFSREITKYMVIYGVYIQFWPTLGMHQCPKGKWETEGARERQEKKQEEENGRNHEKVRNR
jgi:hypothetical protein